MSEVTTTLGAAGVQTPAQVVELCDRCDDGEQRRAEYRYIWEWGEQGNCCGHHAMLLQQAAGNLSRTVQLISIPQGPPPLDRSERVQLKAQVYALEEENRDLRDRATTLYNETERLRADNRLFVVRDGQAKAEIERLRHEAATASTAAHEAERRALAAEEELSLIRPLVRDEEALNADIAARQRVAALEGELEETRAALERAHSRVFELENPPA